VHEREDSEEFADRLKRAFKRERFFFSPIPGAASNGLQRSIRLEIHREFVNRGRDLEGAGMESRQTLSEADRLLILG